MKFWEHNGKQPYFMISLCKNGKAKKFLVHRLVAKAFIPNPLNKEQVNHKDGNVHNNVVDNLEWCTNAENTKHAYENYLRTKNVIWVHGDGTKITLRSFCKKLNLNYKQVQQRLKRYNYDLGKAIDIEGGGKYVITKII